MTSEISPPENLPPLPDNPESLRTYIATMGQVSRLMERQIFNSLLPGALSHPLETFAGLKALASMSWAVQEARLTHWIMTRFKI